jgi:hypothetical protein
MNRGTYGNLTSPHPDLVQADTGLPVGTVVAWMRDMEGVGDLPDGWLECNGQVVTDKRSPLYGQALPDLNGKYLFLRGGPLSGVKGE